jgi:hypothetical protein
MTFTFQICTKSFWAWGVYDPTLGEVDFGVSISYSLQLMGKNNSKTKIEKVFYFIFMSSYAEISFLK